MNSRHGTIIQTIWGALIFGMGIALFFRVSKIIPEIQRVDAFSSDITFKRICLYIVSCLLIGGGLKKIKAQYRILTRRREPQSVEE